MSCKDAFLADKGTLVFDIAVFYWTHEFLSCGEGADTGALE